MIAQAPVIVPMRLEDLPQVMEIDQVSFPQPWTEQSYRFELEENQNAHFIVALESPPLPTQGWLQRWLTPTGPRRVIGFAGFWLVVDEAHINTIAVHPHWRRQGIGERLLGTILERARAINAVSATLEVRVSNLPAQKMYAKFGFEEVGRRKKYYRDGEDALLMTLRFEPNPPGWQMS